METKTNPLKEIFDELFGLLESLEAQSMAVMQFLKDQNAGNDKKLTPYLEQAGNASSEVSTPAVMLRKRGVI